MAPNGNSSLLLHVLGQIQDCSLLLSFLNVEDAKNLSLACRELNRLCFQACKRITVPIGSCNDAATAAAIPRCFGNCRSVCVGFNRADDMQKAGTVLLQALARLPKLHMLQLQTKPNCAKASEAPMMAALLMLMHVQLPGLKQLTIRESNSWFESSAPWQVLGKFSNLQQLCVKFVKGVTTAVNFSHLRALQALSSNLQSLRVDAHNLQPVGQDYSFIGSLTCLTSLWLSLAATEGLSSISACTKLRSLSLCVESQQAGQIPSLQDNDFRALAMLTQLTELKLPQVGGAADNDECLAALRCLQHLEVLRVDGLNRHALPALASLTKLSELGVAWSLDDVGDASTSLCSLDSVKVLGCCGPVPMQAFRKVERIDVWSRWPVGQFISMAQYCKDLRHLDALPRMATTSMPKGSSVAERAAAMGSFVGLKHLTALQFAPVCDADLAVLPQLTGLVSLHLGLPFPPACNHDDSFMRVCSLSQLKTLVLFLNMFDIWDIDGAFTLITELNRVTNVQVYI